MYMFKMIRNIWPVYDVCLCSSRCKATHKTIIEYTFVLDQLTHYTAHAFYLLPLLPSRGLSDCVPYFPEDMSLGRLRDATPHDLRVSFRVNEPRDRERIMRAVEEARLNDSSDTEVGGLSYVYKLTFFVYEFDILSTSRYVYESVCLPVNYLPMKYGWCNLSV